MTHPSILDDIDAETTARYGARKPGRIGYALVALLVVLRRAQVEVEQAAAAR